MSLYKTCPFCGNNIDAQATRCAFCKKLLYEVEEKSIPPEIRRFNWGAFLFNFIWGIFNKTYITLIILFTIFIPFGQIIDLGLCIWFGIKGNEWAWKNKNWESVEEFNKVQKRWAIVALILGGGLFLLGFTTGLIGGFTSLMNKTNPIEAKIECKKVTYEMPAAIQIGTSKAKREFASYKNTQDFVQMVQNEYIGVTSSDKNSFTVGNKKTYKFKINGTCKAANKNCIAKISTSDNSKVCSFYLDTEKYLVPTEETYNWIK